MSTLFSIHSHLPSNYHFSFSSSLFSHPFSKSSLCYVSFMAKDKQHKRCRAMSKSRSQEYEEVFQTNVETLKLSEINVEDIIVMDDDEEQDIRVGLVNKIKTILSSLEDGEITISAYDTAWVALVEDVDAIGTPQFPSSLEWIAKNQLQDGSWGDSQLFLAHDRIINTLACVIALRSWNMHPEKCDKGIIFFKENLGKLENDNEEHMTIGFEVAFPSLLERARGLNIDVPNDSPILKNIFAKRDEKLKRIPREIMHKVPTTLLFSLEGMSGLDWKQLLKLQSQDGSFLFSPSSTAFALMQTKDRNCLKYLNNIVKKFNGGAPNVYPVDLFEHVWVVDRLERLGISRYFHHEIKDLMNYVFRYWTEKGICWAKNSNIQDLDDTSMAFRLLRLHGHPVSANVFKHFERNGEFFCCAGQSTQSVTVMYNLYRATQVLFPGEEILQHAKHFSTKFLKEKKETNELIDKWIIMKNLPAEVAYALDIPWYANLGRVEARFYIDQYGAESDVWIGKTLYRMSYLNNNNYLEFAKLDYNNCQAQHLTEWSMIQKWYLESRLSEFGLSKRDLLLAYFLAAGSIFEPERSHERLAWAKSAALLETITSYIKDGDLRKDFVKNFNDYINRRDYPIDGSLRRNKTKNELVEVLVATIDQIARDICLSYGHEIGYEMHQCWGKWLSNWQSEGDRREGEGELLVQIINLSSNHGISEEQICNPQYKHLLQLTNSICHQLSCYQKDKDLESNSSNMHENITTSKVESKMQELVQMVFQKYPNDIDFNIKNTFLTVAKSFYYVALCDSRTINFHISKVLFDKVV
ncbi:ent-copalyl diphosphate synthase, chloroplastic-like isoform X2 [Vicia villosa]|uniref:ent-copalyl diphosphate synthase, chloroplastic-like isoform X2 n=1 Tax=Vicia villosa TaxID=3911 RepID=UPI00273C0576|nr:ent-copalyl diphosphate synthase, chloroplastic-like isoform X2 [Vicia villosa]